ncbi:MAG: PrsW family intramembrane metalloprotease [Armatimonadetes bacterium]|nr:PrsW family intramembrane metalloprotease [Armatimonadota bacterium]
MRSLLEIGPNAAWVLLAVVFAGIWVYALYREDIRNPEPIWMLLLAAGAGVGAFLVADRVEGWLPTSLYNLHGPLQSRAALAFLVIGPVEELIKFLGVLVLVWPWTHFDEPMDGLVYAAAAGAGFALVENLEFMREEPAVILSRGPAATCAHVLFAAFWGAALGQAKHLGRGWKRLSIVAVGLALASLAHGAFDLVTFSVNHELTLDQGRVIQIALVGVCLVFLRWRIRAALKVRPFQYRRKQEAPPR